MIIYAVIILQTPVAAPSPALSNPMPRRGFTETAMNVIDKTGFKYCPNCTSDIIMVHDTNAVRCGACGYTYFHNAAAAVAGLVETDKGLLFIRRASEPGLGLLDLPGGFVDHGESLEQALIRELREEIGVGVIDLRYLASFPNIYVYKDVTYHTTDVFFTCRRTDGGLPRCNHEASEIVCRDARTVKPGEVAFESSVKVLELYATTIAGKRP